MYAQLGDIKFEGLLGPNKVEDTFATDYAEHPLVENKPRLEAIGEKLQEMTLGMKLHRIFCTPELEFDKLNNYRINHTVLPLLWGTGDIEGDFVIISINRKFIAQADDGAAIEMDLDVMLKEFYDPDKIGTEKKRAQREAFATSLTNPLPENQTIAPRSPAAAVIRDVNDADVSSNNFAATLDDSVEKANSYSAVIQQAQVFVDTIQAVSSRVQQAIDSVNNLVAEIQLKMTANPQLAIVAPALNASLVAAQSSINFAVVVIGSYSSMPNPVTTTSQALSVLTIMSDTTNATTNLVASLKEVKRTNQPLVSAVLTRKVL